MRILAIDQATKTGFAHSDEDGNVITWSEKLTGDHKSRALACMLTNIREMLGIDAIVAEGNANNGYKSFSAGALQLELRGAIITWCECNGIPDLTFLPPSTWRKILLGDGRPKDPKKAVRSAVTALGHNPKNYDQSDALGILEAYKIKHGAQK